MPWQQAASDKIKPVRVGGLFMDMGTGKSRTSIDLVQRRINKIDRVIWFCPVSVKETVKQEILKHTDCNDIYVFDDKTTVETLPKVRWYVIGIESMSSSDRVVLTTHKLITAKTFIILDESSYIKGHQSMRTQRITSLCKNTIYRLALTGTPLSQGIVDLFSQMRFLSPKILGYNSFYSFDANHLEYSEKYPGKIVRAHNTDYIAAKIQPYVYQVTKKECMTLPKKLYETRYFGMKDEQWHYYQLAKEELLNLIDPDRWDSTVIFRLFGILQQIASGFWNYKIPWEYGKQKPDPRFKLLEFDHNRISTLMNIIYDIPKDEKIIIWAKYKYDIEHIKIAIIAEYGPDSFVEFTGSVPEKKRNAAVERFRGPAKFFIATQSAGGHGLTLNEAHYVIFYNNGFKYSERIQAEDRCYRIGQEYSVTYIDIHCACTIDDRIWKSLCNKENVADSFRSEVNKIKNNKVKLKELIKNL